MGLASLQLNSPPLFLQKGQKSLLVSSDTTPGCWRWFFPFSPSCRSGSSSGWAEAPPGRLGAILSPGKERRCHNREQGIKELKKGAGDDFTGILPHKFTFTSQRIFVCLLGLLIRRNRIDNENNQIQLNLINCPGSRKVAFQGGGGKSTVIGF